MAAAAPAGPPPTISTSNTSFLLSSAAWRTPALVSSLARISSTLVRPWPKCSPFRNIIGTAMIWRSSTSFGNTPPSMVVTLMRGLITDIAFKACTTSGQLWQVSEIKVSKTKSPSRLRTCSMTASSSLMVWPPTCSSASTSEVNSWPIGTPAKRTPMSVPGRLMLNEGLRTVASADTVSVILSLNWPMSWSRSCIAVLLVCCGLDQDLDLADQVQRWGQRGGAFGPFSRADFAWVRSDVQGGFDFAQQFRRVAADAVVVHFHQFDVAFRIDDEGAAQRQAFFFDHHFEIAGQRAGRVADQRVVDFLDRVRGVVPGFVREVGVGRHAVDVDAQFGEFRLEIGQVFQFGRADEGEVGWVEHQHGPLAFQGLVADVNEFAVGVGGGFERFDLGIDQGHGGFLLGCESLRLQCTGFSTI